MSRRTALGGLVAIAAFVALAWLSAAWSPLARGPVLDGLGPLAPYRWVSPPPDAPDDRPPLPGAFELPVGPEGSDPDVLFTPDDQVTLIMDRGAVGAAPGRRAVDIAVTPLDPADLAPLPEDLVPFGNAIRIEVDDVTAFDGQVDAILLYPATVSFHATRHELLWSADGASWTPLESTDTIATQQAQATVDAPGYLVVGAVPVPHPSASVSPTPTGGASGSAPIAVVVVGAVALLAVAVVARRRARTARR